VVVRMIRAMVMGVLLGGFIASVGKIRRRNLGLRSLYSFFYETLAAESEFGSLWRTSCGLRVTIFLGH
jgi:hypothetical protein